jgi:small subunit ribosomal protein S1
LNTVVETGGMESFAEMFEESLKRQEMRHGEVITAEVLRIDHNFVVVNAGLKSESYIPVEEFHNDRGELDAQPGDFISVAIESIEDGFGETRLSRDRAKRLAAWLSLEKALESGELVSGTVNGKVFLRTAFVLSCRVHSSMYVLSKTHRLTKVRRWNSV